MVTFLVHKDRVLVPIGVPCPFGRTYCYMRGKSVGEGREDPLEILSSLKDSLKEHGQQVETLQFGYDGDPLSVPLRAIAMLKVLIGMDKQVNFSTKGHIHDTFLSHLQESREAMPQHLTLSALVSLSCWQSAPYVEPHTPAPSLRMQTVSNLRSIALSTFLAVRPILPHIGDAEYERIAEQAQDAGAQGFILGPLYDNLEGSFTSFIPQGSLQIVPRRRNVVPWSPHQPVWDRYEDPDRLARLAEIGGKRGKVFMSSADAMKHAAARVACER